MASSGEECMREERGDRRASLLKYHKPVLGSQRTTPSAHGLDRAGPGACVLATQEARCRLHLFGPSRLRFCLTYCFPDPFDAEVAECTSPLVQTPLIEDLVLEFQLVSSRGSFLPKMLHKRRLPSPPQMGLPMKNQHQRDKGF